MTDKEVQNREKHESLALALHAIYEETGYVKKSGKIKFGKTKYSFAGEVDLIKALRPVMIKHGVLMLVKEIKDVEVDKVSNQKYDYKAKQLITTTNILVTANYTFEFIHVDSDQRMICSALGQGADSLDKAAYKAATGALKYALRQSFIIETGDDPDKTSSDEQIQNGKKVNVTQAMDLWNEEKMGKPEDFYEKCVDGYQKSPDLYSLEKTRNFGKKWMKELVNSSIATQEQAEDLESIYKDRKAGFKNEGV